MKNKLYVLLLMFLSFSLASTSMAQGAEDISWLEKQERDEALSFEKRKDYEQAITHHENAAKYYSENFGELGPGYLYYLDRIGRCYYHLGDFEKALEYHIRALDLLPKAFLDNELKLAEIRLNIIATYLALGNYERAAVLFNEYQAKTPGEIYGRAKYHQKSESIRQELTHNKTMLGKTLSFGKKAASELLFSAKNGVRQYRNR